MDLSFADKLAVVACMLTLNMLMQCMENIGCRASGSGLLYRKRVHYSHAIRAEAGKGI